LISGGCTFRVSGFGSSTGTDGGGVVLSPGAGLEAPPVFGLAGTIGWINF
jgi:hypothetical protein